MVDTPELSGPNTEANKTPTTAPIRLQPIKSDNHTVDGVVAGVMRRVHLDAEQFGAMVDSSVSAALQHRSVPMRSSAVLSAAAQLRSDVSTGISPYITARNGISRQLHMLLQRRGLPGTNGPDQQSTINAVILERSLNARLQEGNLIRQKQLHVSQDLLGFHKGTAATYMKQNLALSYRQLYTAKNLITLTRAFSEMVENKLEAIKINTKIPDIAKSVGLFRGLRIAAEKEAKAQLVKYAVGQTAGFVRNTVIPGAANILASGQRPDVSAGVSAFTDKAGAVIRRSQVGGRVLDAAQARANALLEALGPAAAHVSAHLAQFDQRHHISDRYHPDLLWQKSQMQRNFLANLLRRVAGKETTASGHQTPDAARTTRTSTNVPPSALSTAPPGIGRNVFRPVGLAGERLSRFSTATRSRLSEIDLKAAVDHVRQSLPDLSTITHATTGALRQRIQSAVAQLAGLTTVDRQAIVDRLLTEHPQLQSAMGHTRDFFADVRARIPTIDPHVITDHIHDQAFGLRYRMQRQQDALSHAVQSHLSEADIGSILERVKNTIPDFDALSKLNTSALRQRLTQVVDRLPTLSALDRALIIGRLQKLITEHPTVTTTRDRIGGVADTIQRRLSGDTAAIADRFRAGATTIRQTIQDRFGRIDGGQRPSMTSDDFKATYVTHVDRTNALLESIDQRLANMSSLGGGHDASPGSTNQRSLLNRLFRRGQPRTTASRGILSRVMGAGVGMVTGTLGLYGSGLRLAGKTVTGLTNTVFGRRENNPFTDVYLKNDVKLGKPLVTTKQFRNGVVFGNGKPVRNVADIDEPVIDPKTGQTLISEDDIKIGLVDAFGVALGRRKTQFSLLGGAFDLAKFGIKNLAKPMLDMYGSLFKIIPKAIFGVGSFISKSLIGILSGKAPGAMAKGMMGIANSITSMYAGMFGMGLKTLGGIGKGIGSLFGFGGSSTKGAPTKKDIYDLISVRLDHIYDLLDHRLCECEKTAPRAGSYADHVKKLRSAREKLRHIREDESGGTKGKAGFLASLLGFGKSKKEGDEEGHGGLVDTLEEYAEMGALGFAGRKFRGLAKGGLGLAKRGLARAGGHAAEAVGLRAAGTTAARTAATTAARAAEKAAAIDVAKTATGAAVKTTAKVAGEEALKVGTKDLLKFGVKKIPILGALAGAGFAADRAWHGDWLGAGAELASGVASIIPVYGTAASVVIDLALAARDLHNSTGKQSQQDLSSSSRRILFTTRMNAYGTDNVTAMLALENRIYNVIRNRDKKLTGAELQSFAKSFGLDATKPDQVLYFQHWAEQRMFPALQVYLTVLKKHGYDFDNEDTIAPADIKSIIADYNTTVISQIQKVLALVPSLAGFNKFSTKPIAPTKATPPTPVVQKPITAVPTTPSPAGQRRIDRATTEQTRPAQASPVAGTTPINTTAVSAAAATISPLLQPVIYRTTPTGSAASAGVASTEALSYTPSGRRVGVRPPANSNIQGAPTSITDGGQSTSRVSGVVSGLSASQATTQMASIDNLPKGSVGSGQCVALVQQAAGLGHTSTWQKGDAVLGNPNLKPGTPIACFDSDGKYGNHTNGTSHAAIYLGPSLTKPGGIRVYDQWAGHPASIRDIGLSGSPVNNAKAFSVITTNTPSSPTTAQATPGTAASTGVGVRPPANSNIPGAPTSMTMAQTTRATAVDPADTSPPSPGGIAASPDGNIPSRLGMRPPANNNGVTAPVTSRTMAETTAATRMSLTPGIGAKSPGVPQKTNQSSAEFYASTRKDLYDAAVKKGLPNPGVVADIGAAQSSIETGYGKHVVGNNYFGIKTGGGVGKGGVSAGTTEVINGKTVSMNQNFAAFDGKADSASGYIDFLAKNPRYKGLINAKTHEEGLAALQKSGYATDPNYHDKVGSVIASRAKDPVTAGSTQVASSTTPPPADGTPGSSPTVSGSSDQVQQAAGATTPVSTTGAASPSPDVTPTSTPQPTMQRTPIGASPGYNPSIQQAAFHPSTTGPDQSVINPIRDSNVTAADFNRRSADYARLQMESTQRTQMPPPQIMAHPELLANSKVSANAAQMALTTLGGIHNTLRDLHSHMKDAHGDNGIFADMNANLKTAASNPGGHTVIAPTINAPKPPDKKDKTDIGLDVSKKREPRYAI